MYKENMYEGVPRPVTVGEVVMPRDLVSKPLAEGMQQVAANVGGMIMTGVQMEDGKREFEAKRDLMSAETDLRLEVDRGLHLPDGHPEAFFDKQGNLREVAVENLRAKYEKRLAGIGGMILDPARRQEVQATAGLTGARMLDGLAETWQKVQREKTEQSWRDAYELAVAEGRTGEAMGVIDRGVAMGLFSENRGKSMKLKLRGAGLRAAGGRARAGEPVSVEVNGTEYSGASAALAAAAAKDGVSVGETPEIEAESEAALTLDEERLAEAGLHDEEGTPMTLQQGLLTGVEPAEREAVLTLDEQMRAPVIGQEAGESRVLTLNEQLQSRLSGREVVEPEKGGLVSGGVMALLRRAARNSGLSEAQKAWTLMPEAVVQDFCAAMDDSVRLTKVENDEGGLDIFCRAYAPEVVQRVAARANVAGELTADDAGEMVVRIALDTMHENPAASVEAVGKMFDGAGVYEALGDGDETVGKVRVAALVQDAKDRMEYGTNKLGMEAIKRMVVARSEQITNELMDSPERWRRFEGLNPGVGDSDWDDRDDPRWHLLKEYYHELRREYDSSLPLHDDYNSLLGEYEQHAQRFYNWYMKNKYAGEKKSYVSAIQDWYMAQVQMRLLDSAAGGGRYGSGGSYAGDVAVAREVLKLVPPNSVGAVDLARVREEQEKQAAARGKALRAEAKRDYEKLRGLKAERVESKARAEAKAKREAEAEKAAEKEAEKKREAVAKQEAEAERRRYAMARMRRRQSAWRWDGKQVADGEVPQCSVPESVLKMMVEELGYDGETAPYVVVGSKKVAVTGHHKGGEVLLNTPAAMLLQDKKGKLRVQGELGYSFEFKAVK